jgi:2-aminoethylphosphonate-pyruvate transaminase
MLATMIAVILAAGQGVRIRPLTYSVPKGLLRLDDRPLLRYSLANLHRSGIDQAIIVVGYKGELVRRELGNTCEGVKVTYLENSEYQDTGSMYSFLKAETEIETDILLLESDLVYEPRAIDYAMQSPERDLILVAAARGTGDEVYIRAAEDRRLIDLGKQIGRKKTIGELVGISKLSLDFLRRMFIQARREIQRDRGISYEEVISATARHYSHPVYCVYVKDLVWTDVDNENDLQEAVRLSAIIKGK